MDSVQLDSALKETHIYPASSYPIAQQGAQLTL